ncbi:MAG: hypothetical protein WD894_04385 [Pirellulales bacterium]
MSHTNVVIAGAILLGTLGAVETMAIATDSTSVNWTGKQIRCTAKGEGARARVKTTPEACRVQLEFAEGITHFVVIRSDELLVSSDALGITKPQRREFSGGVKISIEATRDSLAVEILEQHSSSHSSESTSSSSNDSSTSTKRSSSTSTSRSSEVKFFKIVRWNEKSIELSLEGGNSVQCAVDRDGQECNIKFDIDKGKNKRTLSLGPERLTIDGTPREIGGEYVALFITATRRTLKVETDKGVVGSWKGGMERRVLTDGAPNK